MTGVAAILAAGTEPAAPVGTALPAGTTALMDRSVLPPLVPVARVPLAPVHREQRPRLDPKLVAVALPALARPKKLRWPPRACPILAGSEEHSHREIREQQLALQSRSHWQAQAPVGPRSSFHRWRCSSTSDPRRDRSAPTIPGARAKLRLVRVELGGCTWAGCSSHRTSCTRFPVTKPNRPLPSTLPEPSSRISWSIRRALLV